MKSFLENFLFGSIGITATFAALLLITAGFTVKLFQSELGDRILKISEQLLNAHPAERVYVQFDKPLYKPGETIWFTAYLRNADNLKPSRTSDIINVQVFDPKGNSIKSMKMLVKGGSVRGDFDIPNDVPGGLYKLKAFTNWQNNDPDPYLFEKEIQVQKVVLPRLKMKLDFDRKAYGAGDAVSANLQLETNDNQPLAEHDATFVVQLAGKEVLKDQLVTLTDGSAKINFELPGDLQSNEGLLNVQFKFEGSTESISRSVPIQLNQIALELLPEGGYLVNGAQCRLGFKAVNEFGKPADIAGRLVNESGETVSEFSSFHDGMGAIAFTADRSEKYLIEIDQPNGAELSYQFPEIISRGYSLKVDMQDGERLPIEVYSTEAETLHLAVSVRSKTYISQSFAAKKGVNKLDLDVTKLPIGVAQITLFDSKEIPRSERLSFVNAGKKLSIDISTNKEKYQPRERVEMTIAVKDERGMPMPGIFSLAVVDDNLLSFADDKTGSILSKVLVEPDLKGKVHESGFYFDPDEEKAGEALDFLLLTSGWRRYSWRQKLKGELGKTSNPAEKAQIAGRVIDVSNHQPVKNAEIKLGETVIQTDTEGRFAFNAVDLSEPLNAVISAKGYNEAQYPVVAYNQNLTFHINNFEHLRMLDDAFMQDGIMLEEAPAVRGVKRKNARNFEAFNLAPAAADIDFGGVADLQVREAAADIAPLAPLDLDEQMEGDFIADDDKNVFDREEEIAFAWEMKKEAQEGQRLYYRAKEFTAPKYKEGEVPEVRTDFRSTVYWNGRIEIDESGKTTISFHNNDMISSFRATLEGFADDGSIGHQEEVYYTQNPVVADTKLPVELVLGDEVQIPVFLKNNTANIVDGSLKTEFPRALRVRETIPAKISLRPNESKVIWIDLIAEEITESSPIKITYESGSFKDAFSKDLKVVSRGFPVSTALSGSDLRAKKTIDIKSLVPGSIKAKLTAYPTVMTELMSGIETIIREPYGCFEQTSSSNYPNIMVLNYLRTLEVADPTIEADALAKLERGYGRLTSYETGTKGYEWFGQAPGHEALTAYGIMQFVDMREVMPAVSEEMIARTSEWMLAQRDDKGGFKRNAKALDSFGRADDDVTDCYIVYALTEAGFTEIETELDLSYRRALKSEDPYLLALAASSFYNSGKNGKADELLKKLIALQNDDGSWTAKKHSITRSGGKSLTVETTSLAVLAILKAEKSDAKAINSAVQFLVEARTGYGFGSTQATVLALKALTEFAIFSKKTASSGAIEVLVNGKRAGFTSYEAGHDGAIEIEGIEKALSEGRFDLEVRYRSTKEALPFTLEIDWNTYQPQSSIEGSIGLEIALNKQQTKVGETVQLSANVTNKTAEGQPMTMAIIGIPAGLTAQPWQLKELQEKGTIDFYETSGNNVICYYRQMKPSEVREIKLDLKAEIPGKFDANASRAYLYYTSEHKDWQAAASIEVLP